MNPRLLILLLFLATGMIAHAQQQERKLLDRIYRPNMALGALEQQKTFGASKSFSSSAANSDKHFSFLPQFPLKGFFTKSYNTGSKDYWTGEYKPYTRNSNLASKAVPTGADKQFETKTMDVSTARESGKTYAANNAFQTREGKWEGKSQKAITEQSTAKPMTIDDVRDLLNKNK